jgi:hypothetical protein
MTCRWFILEVYTRDEEGGLGGNKTKKGEKKAETTMQPQAGHCHRDNPAGTPKSQVDYNSELTTTG